MFLNGNTTTLQFTDWSKRKYEISIHPVLKPDAPLESNEWVAEVRANEKSIGYSDKKEYTSYYNFEEGRYDGRLDPNDPKAVKLMNDVELADFITQARYGYQYVVTEREARRAFAIYMQTLKDSSRGPLPTSADIDHSALLGRLMHGHPVLPFAPPRTHSYPNYTLGEGKPYYPCELFKPSGKLIEFEPDALCIDQCCDWKIVSDLELEYKPTGVRFRLNKPIPNWRISMDDRNAVEQIYFLQTDPPRAICRGCNGTKVEIKGAYLRTENGKGIYSEGGVECTLCGGSGLGELIELKD